MHAHRAAAIRDLPLRHVIRAGAVVGAKIVSGGLTTLLVWVVVVVKGQKGFRMLAVKMDIMKRVRVQ